MIQRSRASARPNPRKVLAILFAAFSVVALAACVEEPPPTDPNTPWMEPGCYSSDMEGVPDFEFSGQANTFHNSTGFFDEDGNLVEDGSCEGTPGEPGTVVRANGNDAAIAACAGAGITVSTPPQLVDYGYNTPVDAWACINQVEDPEIVEFSSDSTVTVNMASVDEEGETTYTTVDFSGLSTGTWDPGSGDFVLNQTVDDGSFGTSIGVTVGYTAAQNGTSTGSFDPVTGEGGFTLDVAMSLVTLNETLPIDQPCTIGALLEFEGALDFDTGVASVDQEGFTMTPPGEGECGAIGPLISDMFAGGGEHLAEMAIQVLPAPAAE